MTELLRGPAFGIWLIGMGVGALIDGIVLHQILRWHHMISNWHEPHTLDRLETNVLADGIFNGTGLMVLLAGIAVTWTHRNGALAAWSWIAALGVLVIGWGSFNMIDGVVNHYLLGTHHVREGAHAHAYNIGFFVFSIGLLAAGWALYREGKHVR